MTVFRDTTKGHRLKTRSPQPQHDAPRPDGDELHVLGVPGIHHRPEDDQGWTDRAKEWHEEFTRHNFYRQEYWTSFLHGLRSLRNARQVMKLVHWSATRPDNSKLRLIGHSNGCDIICSALPHIYHPIEEVHLIAGAVEHDFSKNNLETALNAGQVGLVVIYASRGDWILSRLARVSRFIFRKWGYGFMGWMAARDRDRLGVPFEESEFYDNGDALIHDYRDGLGQLRVRIVDMTRMRAGHCGMFDPEHFHNLMRRLNHGGINPIAEVA